MLTENEIEKIENPQNVSAEGEPSTVELAKAYQDLKNSSVSIEKYNALLKEREELVNQVINGDSGKSTETDMPSVEELRKDLFGNPNINNLEYATKTLQLRKQLMDKGEADIFLPSGSQVVPTYEDKVGAEHVAEVLQDCINKCEGDSGVFTSLLQSRMKDISLPKLKR